MKISLIFFIMVLASASSLAMNPQLYYDLPFIIENGTEHNFESFCPNIVYHGIPSHNTRNYPLTLLPRFENSNILETLEVLGRPHFVAALVVTLSRHEGYVRALIPTCCEAILHFSPEEVPQVGLHLRINSWPARTSSGQIVMNAALKLYHLPHK